MSRPTRVVVAGAAGRLGTVAMAALEAADDLHVTGTLLRGDDADARLAPGAADVLLDVSLAPATRILAPLAARRGIRPVIGTSGLTDDDVAEIARACHEGSVGGLIVPNFSLGAVLQMVFAQTAAHFLECTGIDEVHHTAKRDSPSGTARMTAARIAAVAASARTAGRDGAADPADTLGEAASRPPPIRSERRDDALAEQRVTFAGPHESLVLSHAVTDRVAYVPGVLLAVRSVGRLDGLAVGLDALLDGSLG